MQPVEVQFCALKGVVKRHQPQIMTFARTDTDINEAAVFAPFLTAGKLLPRLILRVVFRCLGK